jgi:hypothetical protein
LEKLRDILVRKRRKQTMRVGTKIKLTRGRSITPSMDGLVGEVVSLRADGSIKASFILTDTQYSNLDKWQNGVRLASNEIKCTWVLDPSHYIPMPRKLSVTEKKQYDELAAKKNRSPVEDFILFGLEE